MPDVGADPHSGRRSLPVVLIMSALALAVAALCSTQWVAFRFGYHENLGRALVPASRASFLGFACGGVFLVVAAACLALLLPRWRKYAPALGILGLLSAGLSLGPVYAPHKVVAWMVAAAGNLQFAWVPRQAAIGMGLGFLLSVAALLPLLRSEPEGPSVSAGSARWGSGKELKKGEGEEEAPKKPGREDWLIGRKNEELLHYGGESHLLTCAPTRSGKGTGAVIPNLLSYRGPVVVNDPKAENWHVTRRFRMRKLRHQCVALDPFGIADGSDGSFNPLDVVDPGSLDWNDDARMIADMLVVGNPGGGMSRHWNEEAKALLTGLVLYVTRMHGRGDPKRSLIEVRRLLSLPPKEKSDSNEKSGNDEEDAADEKEVDPLTGAHGDPKSWKGLLEDMQRAGGLVARAANRQLGKPPREAGSVRSSANRHTHFLDSPRMKRVLQRTTFDAGDLVEGDLSLYLVLPPKAMGEYQGWLRVVLASMVRALTSADRRPRRRVLFLLDEFAQLGHMQPLEDAVSLVAGYGITLWFFVQNLGQLKSNYDDSWQTFLGNVDVLQVFGTKDEETQEYVSKAAGEQTIFQRSTTRDRGKSGSNVQRGQGSSISETGRRLVKTDEIRRMPISKQLLFVENLDPIYADKLFYLEDDEFSDDSDDEPPLYDENPLHDSASA